MKGIESWTTYFSCSLQHIVGVVSYTPTFVNIIVLANVAECGKNSLTYISVQDGKFSLQVNSL